MQDDRRLSLLDRALNLFTEVHAGESTTALLLALNVFIVLMAYYLLKPVREALILAQGSAELKSYMSAFQVGVLALVVPLYGRLVASVPRMTLINRVTLFFAACPVVFFVLARLGLPLGVVFFVWIGIFNLMIVAQFWSFANVVYSKPEGERLFPIVGFGASLGAVAGAFIADRLIEPVGVYGLMLLGAATIAVQLLLTNAIDRRERRRGKELQALPARARGAAGNAFSLVMRSRYLLLIALMLLTLNWVNSTGEYILGRIVRADAVRAVASSDTATLTAAQSEQVGQRVGAFYARYFTLVNVSGLLLQLLVVSRLVRWLGVEWAVMILPALSFGAYNILAFAPTLSAVLAAKVAENSTDYSLNNTVRNMLFLPLSYEQKFSGKQVIDSFFVRMGDVLSAVLVFAGTTLAALSPGGFALVNVVLVLAWLAIAWQVGRRYHSLTEANDAMFRASA